jgi:hypothetical protein
VAGGWNVVSSAEEHICDGADKVWKNVMEGACSINLIVKMI